MTKDKKVPGNAQIRPRSSAEGNCQPLVKLGCCLSVMVLGLSFSADNCWASSEPSSSHASAKPLIVVPWPQSTIDARPLVEQMRERDKRSDPSYWPRPVAPSLNPNLLSPNSGGSGEIGSDARSGLRKSFGSFEMPFGRMSFVSREIDEYGRVSDISFLQIDDPNSHWDMEVEVDDGAIFAISRKWGASTGRRPFANKDKKNLTTPY